MSQSSEYMNRLLRGNLPDRESPRGERQRGGAVSWGSADGGARDTETWPIRDPQAEANEALRDALHEWWRGRRL